MSARLAHRGSRLLCRRRSQAQPQRRRCACWAEAGGREERAPPGQRTWPLAGRRGWPAWSRQPSSWRAPAARGGWRGPSGHGRPARLEPAARQATQPSQVSQWGVFLFLYFSKSFFTEIYFWFYNLQLCTPTAGRPAPCRLPGGRDQNINKIYIFVSGGACRPSLPGGRYPPPTGEAVGQPAARQGAAGSPLYIKGLSSPSLSFSSHDIQRGGGRKERWGRELQWRSPAEFRVRTADNKYFSTFSF